MGATSSFGRSESPQRHPLRPKAARQTSTAGRSPRLRHQTGGDSLLTRAVHRTGAPTKPGHSQSPAPPPTAAARLLGRLRNVARSARLRRAQAGRTATRQEGGVVPQGRGGNLGFLLRGVLTGSAGHARGAMPPSKKHSQRLIATTPASPSPPSKPAQPRLQSACHACLAKPHARTSMTSSTERLPRLPRQAPPAQTSTTSSTERLPRLPRQAPARTSSISSTASSWAWATSTRCGAAPKPEATAS